MDTIGLLIWGGRSLPFGLFASGHAACTEASDAPHSESPQPTRRYRRSVKEEWLWTSSTPICRFRKSSGRRGKGVKDKGR